MTNLDIKKEAKIWVIRKSTVVEEKLAQKKEEQEKEIKRNNHYKIYERDSSNKKIEFMDFFYSFVGNKFVSFHFTKSWTIRKYIF